MRATLFSALICLASGMPCSAQISKRAINQWCDRLEAASKAAFSSEALESRKIWYVCSQVVHVLALSDRAEQAIAIGTEYLDGADARSALVMIADAQSQRDDVTGAFQTAKLLPEHHSQRAHALIAIRQAQRGDLTDSVALLDRVSDPDRRNGARKLIIDELIETGRYSEAVAQYSLLKDSEDREEVRQSMENFRKRPEIGDADYIERTLEQTRRLRGRLAGFSDEDAALLRLECRARIAIHERDEAAFRASVDEASRLVEGWEKADRCLAFLSIGAIAGEFGDDRLASRLFGDALDLLLQAGNVDVFDSFYSVHFVLAAGDRFDMITQVMPAPDLHRLAMRIAALNLDLLGALGRGVGANEKHQLADEVYKQLPTPLHRVHLTCGLLDGFFRRNQLKPSLPGATSPVEKDQREAYSVIDRIIADKPPLDFTTTGKHRPQRDFMGPYNVSKESMPEYRGELWQEVAELPELTIDEFERVRQAIVLALWGHGIVYGFPASEGVHDFFVWDDKFFDRTQKIELHPSKHLPEILGPAVAELQRVLIRYPKWRVVFLGHGEHAQDEFFVVYPDMIRILQAENAKSMAEAIRANVVLRLRED